MSARFDQANSPGPPQEILCAIGIGPSPSSALSLAALLARRSGARLSVLWAAEPLPVFELARLARATGRDPASLSALARARAGADAEAAVAATCGDLSPAISVAFGKPFVEIVRAAIVGGHDLVVKSAEKLDSEARSFLASTDQHLLRKCPAPLLLHRDSSTEGGRPVLAAVDVEGEAAGEPATELSLNVAVLDQAVAAAAALDAPLHVVSAWTIPGEGLVRLYGDAGANELAAFADEVEREHGRNLGDLLDAARHRAAGAGFGHVPIAPHLVRGDPRAVIPRVARDLRVGLVVMGTVARTGVHGFFIGNTAEDVLNQVETSILAVKPPGYVSPLAP